MRASRAHPAWRILESRMTRKCHVRFGGGPMEKYRRNTRQLASGLPNRIDTRPWPTRRAARQAIFAWLEVFYNRQRSHSAPDYQRCG